MTNLADTGLGAVLYALDLPLLQAFYRDALDMSESRAEEGFVMLRCGHSTLTLVQAPPHLVAEFSSDGPPERREDTAIKLSFPTESIADTRARAAALGGVIDGPDSEWEFGPVRVCDGHDPEGNVIQVRQHS